MKPSSGSHAFFQLNNSQTTSNAVLAAKAAGNGSPMQASIGCSVGWICEEYPIISIATMTIAFTVASIADAIIFVFFSISE